MRVFLKLLILLVVGVDWSAAVSSNIFKRITFEAYDKSDQETFEKVNDKRITSNMPVMQYSDALMMMAQDQAERLAKLGKLDNPITSTDKKVHARTLKYVGALKTTGNWMGNYKCYDNFMNMNYKSSYQLNENCLSVSPVFTEYGYGRAYDPIENLYVVQLYSFEGEDQSNSGNGYQGANPGPGPNTNQLPAVGPYQNSYPNPYPNPNPNPNPYPNPNPNPYPNPNPNPYPNPQPNPFPNPIPNPMPMPNNDYNSIAYPNMVQNQLPGQFPRPNLGLTPTLSYNMNQNLLNSRILDDIDMQVQSLEQQQQRQQLQKQLLQQLKQHQSILRQQVDQHLQQAQNQPVQNSYSYGK